jgi:hypothetical protein
MSHGKRLERKIKEEGDSGGRKKGKLINIVFYLRNNGKPMFRKIFIIL